MTGYIKQAIKLKKEGVKSPTRSKPKKKKELVVPRLPSGLFCFSLLP
jgi:hypothetical protein